MRRKSLKSINAHLNPLKLDRGHFILNPVGFLNLVYSTCLIRFF